MNGYFLSENFGFSITNLNLRNITSFDVRTLKSKVYAHRLVIAKSQNLSTEEYIEFCKKLGHPEPYLQQNYHHPTYPLIFVSSNVTRDGKRIGVARTGGYWHTDTAFQKNPMPFTVLYPQILPKRNSRSTLFIDMSQVLQGLPEELHKELRGKHILHSGKWHYKVRPEDAGMDLKEILTMIDLHSPPSKHPAIIEHPVTKEPILYASSGFSVGVAELSPSKSDEVLASVFAFTEQDRYIKKAFWEPGDIIIWDNRLLIHKSGRPEASAENIRQAAATEEETMVFRICLRDGFPFYPSIININKGAETAAA